MTITKFLSDAFRENTRCGRGDTHPLITLNIKKDTRTSDFKSNDPIPEFLRSQFLYIYLKCPQGITYNPCPESCGECPAQKHIFYLEINYAEQNGYFKILLVSV
jgi:hypothetical protein